MGTTGLSGLLAWVVWVICPRAGLDNPAVSSYSAAGVLQDLFDYSNRFPIGQTPGRISQKCKETLDEIAVL